MRALRLKLEAQLSNLLMMTVTAGRPGTCVTMETTDNKTQNEIILVVADNDRLCVISMQRPASVRHTSGVLCAITNHAHSHQYSSHTGPITTFHSATDYHNDSF